VTFSSGSVAVSSSSSSLSGGAIAGIVIGGLAGLMLLLLLLFVCYRGMRAGHKKKPGFDAEAYATQHDSHDATAHHEDQVEMEEVGPEAEAETHEANA